MFFIIGCIFHLLCVSDLFIFIARQTLWVLSCLCWVFFVSYKHSWTLSGDTVTWKQSVPFGSSSQHLPGQAGASFGPGLTAPSPLHSHPVPADCEGLSTVELWALSLLSFQVLLFLASGSFFTHWWVLGFRRWCLRFPLWDLSASVGVGGCQLHGPSLP